MKTKIKTSILLIAFLLLGLFSVAQVSYLPPAYVPNATTAKLNLGIPVNTIVFVGSLHVPYICIKEIGGGIMTMTQAIAGSYLTTYPYTVVDSTYLHSTGVEKAYGAYTFYNPLNIFYAAYLNSYWVVGTRGTFSHTQTTADSSTTGYAGTRYSSPSIFCTNANGAIFTATDGTTHYKLQLTGGVATYVTVTP